MQLFGGPAPRVRAIPASAPFLDVFVKAMIEALWRPDEPFALADALVLLPNRRAAQGLMDAFAAELGGAALLPAIRPLGDLDDDPDVWGAEPISLDIPPAIAPPARRLELAQLVRARFRAEGGQDDPARALAMADELCRLLDSAAACEDVRWRELPALVEEAELAAHWQVSAEFLKIVTEYWPARLAADGLADPAARRAALLTALAQHWRASPPDRPIVIAGSTGSIAATRALMRVVAALPQGVVVLPGLDADLDDAAWNAIDAQHPQAALRETLAALEIDRRAVPPLGTESEAGRARRILMREALAPADATADWLARLAEAGGAAMAARALEGVCLVEAANAEEEAALIAVAMRRELEDPAARVALVTADAALSRRVAEKLARWGLMPDRSHMRPLRETPAGSLIALLCELARDPGEPVALAGLLKHQLAAFGLAPAALAQARAELEHVALRGPRRYGALSSLPAFLEGEGARRKRTFARAAGLAEAVSHALAPLAGLPEEVTPDRFADALAEAAERVAAAPGLPGARVWAGRAGDVANKLLRDLIEHGEALGALSLRAAPRALLRWLDGEEAPPEFGGDPRCAIWGPLEARLQRRDLMILGGLNEGVWPAPPREDPFLSRLMREKLGLAPPETRIGLAAHDFAQLACARRVLLTRALKRDGAPSVASRWIWRLDTLLRAAGLSLRRESADLALARALDMGSEFPPAKPPRPRPAASQRLTQLSVTQVETLIRDPYAIYARKLLGLEALKPVGYEPGAAERGTAIHAAIEQGRDAVGFDELMRLLDEALAAHGFSPARRSAERARLAASAREYLAWAAARRGAVFRELRGELQLSEGRRLTGVADRIEITPAGGVIVDYKTGQIPTLKQENKGFAPQLLLEAAMLKRGAFPGAPAVEACELIYWRFGSAKPEARIVAPEQGTPAEAGEAALAALEALLARYADPAQPFLSKPRVQFLKAWDDYDLLARRKEWAEAEEEGE